MSRYRVISYVICFAFLFAVLFGLGGAQIALAAGEIGDNSPVSLPNQDEPPAEDGETELKMTTKYPVLEGESGELFEFEIALEWDGDRTRFDLDITTPPDWAAVIVGGYEEKQISAIELEPKAYAENIKVIFGPLTGKSPEPGEYICALKAVSGDISKELELKAKVTALYEFAIVSGLPQGNLNPKLTAGEDNHLSVLLLNSGTDVIENITFTSSRPPGWGLTFNPAKIESLEPGINQELDVVVSVPGETIPGDYSITLRPNSEDFTPEPLRLRATLETPTIWGGAGIAIVVGVIAGLVVMFMRLGRR